MRNVLFTLFIVLAIGASWAILHQRQAPADSIHLQNETVTERVMRTKTLRCAYIVYPPEVIKDPNTGKLSGAVVEMTGKAAQHLDWRVNWVAEVAFTDAFDGFKSGKYDALCSGMWKSPARAQHGLFTIPTNYGVYHAFMRNGDRRFDRGLDAINNRQIKIAAIDGEYGETVARESYPQATLYRLPPLSDISFVLESVATGKADVAFLQPSVAAHYIRHNPGKLRMLEWPVRAMPAPAIILPPEEFHLQYLLNSAFEFMRDNGEIDRILNRYDPQRLSYRPVNKPYH